MRIWRFSLLGGDAGSPSVSTVEPEKPSTETAQDRAFAGSPSAVEEPPHPRELESANDAPRQSADAPLIQATELLPATDALAELFLAEQPPEEPKDTEMSGEQGEPAADPVGATPDRASAERVDSPELLVEAAETNFPSPPGDAEKLAQLAQGLSDSTATETNPNNVKSPSTRTATRSTSPPIRDWAFEEKLASHDEWVKSCGKAGLRGDFSGAELEGSELIEANLRFAELHDANLKGADLLLADLRGASLMRANLEDACLVGTKLNGANLEGASLDAAMGLAPRQVAGANLSHASLPVEFLESLPILPFERASQTARRLFLAILPVALISALVIWKTKDAQLLTDSAIVPFLHSRASAAALPTAELYLVLPVLMFGLYLLFQFHLQRVWDAVRELPAVFPDGHTLGERKEGVMGGLLCAHFRWSKADDSKSHLIEKGMALAFAYWLTPAMLLAFWVRYLTRQDMHGTMLHTVLVVIATAVAVHATTQTGLAADDWTPNQKWIQRLAKKLKSVHGAAVGVTCGVVLLMLSAGIIAGVPHEKNRAPQYGPRSIRRWASTALWALGADPYADLTEAAISIRPLNWTGADNELALVRGPRLTDMSFRYARAYGAFLVNAHLLRTDFEGAFLEAADMRGADLGQSSLRLAVADQALMNRANLDRSNLDGADLSRADLRDANLSHASLAGATLVDARLDGATLYGARLTGATLTRANLERADLREASLGNAQLDRADVRGAFLSSAKLTGSLLTGVQFENAIAIEASLRGADLRGAEFSGTVLTSADLSGTNLDGADLRGAAGLTAGQVCSAASRNGILLDDAMQAQVGAQCGY